MDQCEFLMHFSYNVVGFHTSQCSKNWGEPKKWENLQKKKKWRVALLIFADYYHIDIVKVKLQCIFQIWEQHRWVRLWEYQLTNYDKFPLSVKMKGLDLGHSTDHLLPRRLVLFRLQKEVTKTASGNKNTTDSEKKCNLNI